MAVVLLGDSVPAYGGSVHIAQTTLIVENYDEAIGFFVDVMGFDLVEDSPSVTNDGRPKRWVVVRPRGAETGLLLAEADGERQVDLIGGQYAGRVGLFLRVDDFEATRRRMLDRGVEFVAEPRDEPYGRVAVFVDLYGNKWDLLGPVPL
jgi:catechol 2,3-dioxygenase-like lactoylglutathione lyase family enzyme